MRNVLLTVLVIGLGLLAGAIATETAYRTYLVVTQFSTFYPPQNEPLPAFGIYDKSHWQFNRAYGFDYPPDRKIQQTSIDQGRVTSCTEIKAINHLGNVGIIEGSYAAADLKIAVFGDSFTVFHNNGVNWPVLLQRKLTERFGHSVNVLNFARDGMGLVQMIDMAAVKVPEWNPDLVIIAFITDDINRARTWRADGVVDGEERVLTMIEPSPIPDPSRGIDTMILDSRATREWCEKTKASRETDSIILEIEDKYRRLRNAVKSAGGDKGLFKRPNLFTLNQSYVWNVLIQGDPFRPNRYTWNPGQLPRVAYRDFSKDLQFIENLEKLRATGKPILFIHLPYYPELKAGKNIIPDTEQFALIESLEKTLGSRVVYASGYITPPMDDPSRMNVTSENYHPSLFGMNVYADAVSGIIQSGIAGDKIGNITVTQH